MLIRKVAIVCLTIMLGFSASALSQQNELKHSVGQTGLNIPANSTGIATQSTESSEATPEFESQVSYSFYNGSSPSGYVVTLRDDASLRVLENSQSRIDVYRSANNFSWVELTDSLTQLPIAYDSNDRISISYTVSQWSPPTGSYGFGFSVGDFAFTGLSGGGFYYGIQNIVEIPIPNREVDTTYQFDYDSGILTLSQNGVVDFSGAIALSDYSAGVGPLVVAMRSEVYLSNVSISIDRRP